MNWLLLEVAMNCVGCLAIGVKSLRLRYTRDDPMWRANQQSWAFVFLFGAAVLGTMLVTTAASSMSDPPRSLVEFALSLFMLVAIGLIIFELAFLVQRNAARRNERDRPSNP